MTAKVTRQAYHKGGDPYINLALDILLDAKEDAQMWLDCVEEFGENRGNYNSLAVAQWVMEWLKTHPDQTKTMGICKGDMKLLNKFKGGK